MIQEVSNDIRNKMESCISHFKKGLAGIRTGRASTALLDSILVEYYKSTVPLKQLASITIPDSQTISIQPWDVSSVQVIEKAILTSPLGLNPMNDGKIIRVAIPVLTEERRRQLTKVVKKDTEDCKIAVRNVRRDGMTKLKALEKDKEISQDEQKKWQIEIQEITDSFIKKTDELNAIKEKEIMEE